MNFSSFLAARLLIGCLCCSLFSAVFTTESTNEDFKTGGLNTHNAKRAKHGVPPLTWSDDLADKAQELAESLARTETLNYDQDLLDEGYGENIAKVWSRDGAGGAGVKATEMWYTQSEDYNFDDPHLDENTGQFAQIVWKNTKEVGMGVAQHPDDKRVGRHYFYVAALYKPSGNTEDRLQENVLQPKN